MKFLLHHSAACWGTTFLFDLLLSRGHVFRNVHRQEVTLIDAPFESDIDEMTFLILLEIKP